jgi:hypothetical protein
MLSEIELTQLFIDYAEHGKKREEIGKKIEAEILERKESSKIAGVTAKYFQEGFETPDYEQAAKANMPDGFDLSPYSTSYDPSVKWKEVCEALQIEAPKGVPKPARVTIK